MLCVITQAADSIVNITHADMLETMRHNHQRFEASSRS
jgi:hypothetical protein